MTGKKGTFSDLIYIPIGIFFLGFLYLLLVHFAGNAIFDGLQTNTEINQTAKAVEVLDTGNLILNTQFDYISIFIFFSTIALFFTTSFLVSGHPVLVGLYVVGGAIVIYVSAMIANFWEDLTVGTVLVTSLSYFPFTNFIMVNLPWVMAIIWFIGLVITFKAGGNNATYEV